LIPAQQARQKSRLASSDPSYSSVLTAQISDDTSPEPEHDSGHHQCVLEPEQKSTEQYQGSLSTGAGFSSGSVTRWARSGDALRSDTRATAITTILAICFMGRDLTPPPPRTVSSKTNAVRIANHTTHTKVSFRTGVGDHQRTPHRVRERSIRKSSLRRSSATLVVARRGARFPPLQRNAAIDSVA
jgi:hypothetical protein